MPWATMCTVILCFLIRQVIQCLITVWNSRNCSCGKSTCLNVVCRSMMFSSLLQSRFLMKPQVSDMENTNVYEVKNCKIYLLCSLGISQFVNNGPGLECTMKSFLCRFLIPSKPYIYSDFTDQELLKRTIVLPWLIQVDCTIGSTVSLGVMGVFSKQV